MPFIKCKQQSVKGNLPGIIKTYRWRQSIFCHVIFFFKSVWSIDATGLAPLNIFLWHDDSGLGIVKFRSTTALEKSRYNQILLPFYFSTLQPSLSPQKAYGESLAHIQRHHLWEKNDLHLFCFIYIHSWILIQKEKKIESDECLQTRYFQIDFAHVSLEQSKWQIVLL